MQFELLQIGDKLGLKPNKYITYISTVWIFTASFQPFPLLTGGILFLILCLLEIFDKNKKALAGIVSTPFFSLFIPLGMLSIVNIRGLGSEEVGISLTITILLLIWGNDVFAYFGGKHFGKRPLSKELSPNKTLEGFLFGFLGNMAGILVSYLLLPHPFPLTFLQTIPLVLFGGIFGPCGDLLESKMKRVAGIKDSSSIIPGHGGFFDRFDALILTAPMLYSYLVFISYYGFVSF